MPCETASVANVTPVALSSCRCSNRERSFAADRIDLFAAALKQSPVYVSDSITRRIDDADRAALLKEVEAMPFPTYLVVASDLSSETVYGDDRLALLRDALGKDGLYVFSDDRGRLDVAAYGVQPAMRTHDIGIDKQNCRVHFQCHAHRKIDGAKRLAFSRDCTGDDHQGTATARFDPLAPCVFQQGALHVLAGTLRIFGHGIIACVQQLVSKTVDHVLAFGYRVQVPSS